MSDKRISELNPISSANGNDLLVIVNNNETKKITVNSLIGGLSSGPSLTPYSNVLYVDPSGNDVSGNGAYYNPYQTPEKADSNASAGTLIVVMPGEYEIQEQGLTADGVSWYFMDGAKVVKHNSGYIFKYSDSDRPVNILGYGEFETHHDATFIFYYTGSSMDANIKVEAKKFFSTTQPCFYAKQPNNNQELNIDLKVDKMVSSGGECVYTLNATDLKLNSQFVHMTGNGPAIAIKSDIGDMCGNVLLNLGTVKSTSGEAILLFLIENYLLNAVSIDGLSYGLSSIKSHGVINCPEIIAANMTAYGAKIDGGHVKIFGRLYGLHAVNTKVKVNHMMVSSSCKLEVCSASTVYADHVEEIAIGNFETDRGIEVYEAELFINHVFVNKCSLVAHHGGKLNVANLVKEGTEEKKKIIEIFSSEAKIGNVYCDTIGHSEGMIVASGNAKLILNGRIEDRFEDDLSTMLSIKDSEVIFDGATFVKSHHGAFVRTPIQIEDVKVYSSGLSCNGNTGEFLEAKKWRYKFRVSTITLTRIRLTSGSNSVTFESNNSSQDLIAQQLADAINASSSVDFSATSDSGYLYVESGTAGNDCSYSNIINLLPTPLRYNSYGAHNVIPGSLIIENHNIS